MARHECVHRTAHILRSFLWVYKREKDLLNNFFHSPFFLLHSHMHANYHTTCTHTHLCSMAGVFNFSTISLRSFGITGELHTCLFPLVLYLPVRPLMLHSPRLQSCREFSGDTLRSTMMSLIDLPVTLWRHCEHHRSHYLLLHCPHSSFTPIVLFTDKVVFTYRSISACVNKRNHTLTHTHVSAHRHSWFRF